MGNCLRKKGSTEWGGDDWGSFGSSSIQGETYDGREKAKSGVSEVKIKISKKELERLLKEADIEGLPVHQVLAQLKKASHQFEKHQHSWTPALYSIPESP